MIEELRLQTVDLNNWRHPVQGTLYCAEHDTLYLKSDGLQLQSRDLATWTRRVPEWSRC